MSNDIKNGSNQKVASIRDVQAQAEGWVSRAGPWHEIKPQLQPWM